MDRAMVPIMAPYRQELGKLKVTYTKAGNLDAALHAKSAEDVANGKPAMKDLDGEVPQGKEVVLLKFERPGIFRVHKKDPERKWQPGGTRDWAMENVERRQIRIFWNIGARVASLNPKLTEMSDGKNEMTRVELSE